MQFLFKILIPARGSVACVVVLRQYFTHVTQRIVAVMTFPIKHDIFHFQQNSNIKPFQ